MLTGTGTFSGVEQPSTAFELAITQMSTNVAARKNDGYFCIMQIGEEGYVGMQAEAKPVKAMIVPTNTTVDSNVNDMVDILRCELPGGMQQHAKRRRTGTIQVLRTP